MTLRAYLLINVIDDIGQQRFVKSLRELENTIGVEFVDAVSGEYDMIAIVDTSRSIESVVMRLREYVWLKDIEVLRITGIFESRVGAR